MPYAKLNRDEILMRSLSARANRVEIERDFVDPERAVSAASPRVRKAAAAAAEDIRRARAASASVMLAFGAHAVKNGLGPLLIRLIEGGWITHLATNGAGIIHDWEFAFQGASSEDVRANVAVGQFGLWEETGYYLNLAINVGAYEGLGYGEAVGALVEREGVAIPSREILRAAAERAARGRTGSGPHSERAGGAGTGAAGGGGARDAQTAAAALDLLAVVDRFSLEPGFLAVPHPFRRFGLQAAAYRLSVPFTGHPMFGHDIIYAHPMNMGAAIGRTAERDFLTFAEGVSRLEHGVYLSIGSAVMSPMIFEKSLSMARNLAARRGEAIEDFSIHVVDLAESAWDWQAAGEPPPTDPAYYLRYAKTFSRMGGRMRYVQADNRDFLVALYSELRSAATS